MDSLGCCLARPGPPIEVPVSEVGKHFPNQKRTIATGIVTAAASVGYFLAPLFTQYSLGSVGWEQTLKYFMYFILAIFEIHLI